MLYEVITSLYTLVVRGKILPFDADSETWFWLLISGLVGFVIGDIMLFQAFVTIGARVSMLVMSLVPPITAILRITSYNVCYTKLLRNQENQTI